jgi:SAM-dependent methyltransferase
MARSAPYEAHSGRYDRWFPRHEAAYLSELLAVRALLPVEGRGLEVGVGTGRFAAPLGIEVGLDPAAAMLARASARGIKVVRGVAEALPFADRSFDYALMVVVLSFLDDAPAGLAEIHRVLRPGGALVIGFIDKDSPSGRAYLDRHAHKLFFREATFYAAAEAAQLLDAAGFWDLRWVQTLLEPPEDMTRIEALRPGHGDGAFVAVRAARD